MIIKPTRTCFPTVVLNNHICNDRYFKDFFFFSRREVIFRSLETETEKLEFLEKQEAEKRDNGRK